MLLRMLFSPRLIVFLTLLLAMYIRYSGYEAAFGGFGSFLGLLVVIVIASALSLAGTAFYSFDIEAKADFVMDIALDLLSFGGAVGMLVYLFTANAYGGAVSFQAFYLTFIALGLALLDFLVSLNAGAGKLLEMDREHFTKDRRH